MKTKLIITLLVLMSAVSAYGQNGTTLGMGTAYTTLAHGAEALFWNPANLGFHDSHKPSFTMELFSLNFLAVNNAFNMDTYDKYFTDASKVLTSADKVDIISLVPNSGLDLDIVANIPVLTMAYKNFAFGVDFHSSGNVSLPKDFVDVFFTGIGQQTYDFDGALNSEASVSMNFGYGRTFWHDVEYVLPGLDYRMHFTDISLGASIAYNMGIAAIETEEGTFRATINDDGFDVDGRFIAHAAPFRMVSDGEGGMKTEFDEDNVGVAGTGYGLNIAVSARTDDHYVYSLVLKNIVNYINWNTSAMQIDQTFATDDPLFLSGGDGFSDLEEEDYRTENNHEVGSFKTTRPFGFRLGAGREYRNYKYSSEIGMEDEEFVFALGGAYRWTIFNFYAGYNHKFGNSFTTGFGLGNDYVMWDIGFGTHNQVTPGGSKGVIAATSFKFGF